MKTEEFYANVGDQFGVIGPDRTAPHRGVDFPWPNGTPIPSWCDGEVVRNEWNSVIGWIIAIKTAGGWAGHCHMLAQSPLAIGTKVRYGDIVGDVGNTGSASRGGHDHATFSIVGDHPGISPVTDPLPWIRSAIAGQNQQQSGEDIMLMLVSGEDFYTLVSDAGWVDLPPLPRKPNGDMGDLQTALLRLFGKNQLWTKEESAAIKAALPKLGGGAGTGGAMSQAQLTALAKAVAVQLASSFPSLQAIADATAAEIADRGDGLNDGK